MSEPEPMPKRRDASSHKGRGANVVTGLAFVIAMVCGAAAVLSFLKASQVQDDLNETRSSLHRDLSDERQSRLGLENELADLATSVQTVSDDLSEAALTVSNIDSFLSTNDLATAGQVSDLSSALSVLGQYVEDIANCINDNLDATSQRGQLQYCG
jgi:septal ring factor EnvC (AmiA/AmiB activator)